MNVVWWYTAVALAAGVVAAVWPLTPALSSRDALQARLASALVAAIVCAGASVSKGIRPKVWIGVSIVSAVTGIGLMLAHFDASAGCLADYQGRAVIIGRVFAPDIAGYIRDNPGLSPSDRLLDAGGVPERVWTAESIRSCRLLVSWAGLAVIPLFALCASALISRARHYYVPALPTPVRPTVNVPAGAPVYDAFLSYRHTASDKARAIDILESLETRGFRLAIDFRDFAANEHFLSEMERCIKECRFVLCVITAPYLDSDHTSEEAIISKTLDMAERRKRLVPLIFERVELPVWLHGLVGIDFTPSASVDPIERLIGLLKTRPAWHPPNAAARGGPASEEQSGSKDWKA